MLVFKNLELEKNVHTTFSKTKFEPLSSLFIVQIAEIVSLIRY